MSRTRVGRGDKFAAVFLGIVLLSAMTATAWGAAQFRLPKLPKIGKSDSPQQKQAAPTGPLPEVTSLEPNSASPGAEGDLVLTGKNFSSGMTLRMDCPQESPSIKSFKVESATRAVAHVKFGLGTKEGPCQVYIAAVPGASSEIGASTSGTVEVVQVKTVSFTIAAASAMPMCISVVYLAEGNMDFMALMMKMQQAMSGTWDNAGKPQLCVSKKEVKLIQGEKTVFTEPASNVKDVGEMSMGGQSVGIFRIVFTDGKIHNFLEQSGEGAPPKGTTVDVIKAAVGK
ncbi:MAG TPA: hypothetical protein VFM21_02265 [Terriglobia bacterium]|nr:hypothetical protein [Terriglobia bacterium]